MAAILLAAPAARAEDRLAMARPTEYQVKAAFLYNFARFVEWPAPPPPGQPFVIAVVGADPFGRVLDDTVADKTVHGHPIAVRRGGAEAARGAHIVYVSPSERHRLDAVLESVAGQGVLTVADTPGAARRGVMINFVMDDHRVRFEINLRRAETAGLRMSSQLLRLAALVEEGAR
jgi:hypothetical protein